MSKNTGNLDEVRAYCKTLFDADPNVLVSSLTLGEHFDKNCSAVTRTLAQEGVLLLHRVNRVGRSRFNIYKINPEANWTPKKAFDSQEWFRLQRIQEQRVNEIGKHLHDVLFGAGWVMFEHDMEEA